MERTLIFEVFCKTQVQFLDNDFSLDSSLFIYYFDHPHPPDGERAILKPKVFIYRRTGMYRYVFQHEYHPSVLLYTSQK